MGTKTTVSIAMHVRCDCGASKHLGALIERFTCRRCSKLNLLSADRWRELLDAAVHDLPHMKAGVELTRSVDRQEGWVVAERTAPSCASCSAPVPDEALSSGCANGSVFCPGCGAKLLVRPVPTSLASALPGITHLFGEDIGMVANPDGPHMNVAEGASATCPSCGAGLAADGRSHAVVCAHCRSMVVLPDALWDRLNPSAEPHTFYLVHDSSVPRAPFRADFAWGSLHSAVGDKDGNIYVVGADTEAHDDRMIFALDSQLRTKWARRGMKHVDVESRLAWRSDGMLLVWNTRRSDAVFLHCADGTDAGTLGGKQPDGAHVHNLDLMFVDSATVDVDGTVIFVKFVERRLVRCAPDGTGVPIWPAHSGFLGFTSVAKPTPFTGRCEDDDAPDVENIGDYPTTVRECQVRVGWDGRLYMTDGEHFVRFERTGKKSYVTKLPKTTYRAHFGADASGRAYVLLGDYDGEQTASIYAVENDGSLVRLVDGSLDETRLPVSDELIVRADGSMVVLAGHQHVRIFARDGRAVWRSKGAIDSDKEDAEEDDDD